MHHGRWLWMAEPSSLFAGTAQAVAQSRWRRASGSAHSCILEVMFRRCVVSLMNTFVYRKLQRGGQDEPSFRRRVSWPFGFTLVQPGVAVSLGRQPPARARGLRWHHRVPEHARHAVARMWPVAGL